MVKDLHSTNKTYLNGKVIDEALIKTGDSIQIGDYVIEIDLGKSDAADKMIPLEDTQAPVSRGLQLITRALDSRHAPAIRMPAQRADDLYQILKKLAHAGGGPEMLEVLLEVLVLQFHAGRVWCCFRYDTNGIFEEKGGRTDTDESFDLKGDTLQKLIKQACDNRQYFLLSNIEQQLVIEKGQSAIIAPLLTDEGNLGVIYIDSKPGQAPFTMSDLDYAMLLSIYLGIILENF